jgi:hypothetical protein
MKTYSKDINVYCDTPDDKRNIECWFEGSVTLQWWQGKTIAYKMFKKAGWILGKDKDFCPFCSKGTKQPNYTGVDKSEIETNNKCKKQIIIMDTPRENFKPFYFEGNERWGYMRTPEDVKSLLISYTYEKLRRAWRNKRTANNEIQAFGFYAEYNDKYTLGNFIDDNHMEEYFK